MEIDRRIDELVAVLKRLGRRPRKFEVSFECSPETDMLSWIENLGGGKFNLTESQVLKLESCGVTVRQKSSKK